MISDSPFPADFDRRQKYLGEYLTQNGYYVILAESAPDLELEVASYAETDAKKLVLLPVPASAALLKKLSPNLNSCHIVLGGNLSEDFTAFCQKSGIAYIDYMKFPAVAIENAVATAEGAISQAICSSDINLHQSNVLVIGFGKCGEILADKLSGLKCHVFISTRNEEAQARVKSYGYQLLSDTSYSEMDIIFNTAPAPVLHAEIIDRLQPDTIIIDIASRPGGTDFNYCAQKGIVAKHCPGLPGKYSPKTSAQIIYRQLQKVLQSNVTSQK